MLWFPRLVMKVSELLRAAIASELSDAPLVTEIRHNFDKIMTYVRCVPPILRMQLISPGDLAWNLAPHPGNSFVRQDQVNVT
jgi:hypothetical protein